MNEELTQSIKNSTLYHRLKHLVADETNLLSILVDEVESSKDEGRVSSNFINLPNDL